ncbi:hypothetical protein MTR_2g054930 [Medicago truncatula]|uniref:RNase H type-1 domain-containing protein n=1 Tax=Medicago truncatula TaxID=3880 RepID=A0A072V9D6_MEDTR|nr:hypothetical protein MTR_2g054930 [Medicago truncatula]
MENCSSHNKMCSFPYKPIKYISCVVVGASSWQVFSLPDSEVAEALTTQKGLEFAKDMSFLNFVAESDASNVVLALNGHQQSPNYVDSII